jgi:hypothetical protein
MTKEAGERSFDELASGLASGTLSRGKALRLMGAALVGGVLASIPGMAGAAPKPKCPGCLSPCSCRRDIENHVRVCVGPLAQVQQGNCDVCPEGTVCTDRIRFLDGTRGVVCSTPCL